MFSAAAVISIGPRSSPNQNRAGHGVTLSCLICRSHRELGRFTAHSLSLGSDKLRSVEIGSDEIGEMSNMNAALAMNRIKYAVHGA